MPEKAPTITEIKADPGNIERKVFKVYTKAVDEAQGIIEAIVSVFNNEDDGGDVVRLGFFKASLLRKYPKGVWMHDWATPVAKTLEARELAPGDPLLPEKLQLLGGLYIKGQFNLNTQRGREAFSDIVFGIIDEFSMGYCATKVIYNEDDWTRELIEGEIYEWSPVLVGMNRETVLLSAKGADGETNDVVPFARDLEAMSDVVKRVAGRAKARRELLLKQGRVLSQSNLEKLQGVSGDLATIIELIDELCDMAAGEPEEEEPADADDAGKVFDLVAFELKRKAATAALALAVA